MYTDHKGRQIPVTIEEFLPLLIRSELATEPQASELLVRYQEEHLPTTDVPDSLTSFCSFLVADGMLTTWQCTKLRNAQWKGFYLDGWLFLDHADLDQDYSYFLVRHTTEGTIAQMAVVPPARWKGRDVDYRIVHPFLN
jgi:hypothetical protein